MTDRLPSFPAFDRDMPLTIATWSELSAAIHNRLGSRQGFGIVTMNLDHLVKLRSDAAFQHAYLDHDLRVADGNPIVWLSRLADCPVELITGADMVRPLCQIATAEETPIAMVGSRDAVLDAAAHKLCSEFDGLKVVCKIAPPMGFNPTGPDAERIIDEVAASGARLVFIALGAPKQEFLAALGLARTTEIGFVSIGASLDFIAGFEQRAPTWIRRLALEWVWRMLSNPKRMVGRYWKCALMMPSLTRHAWRQRNT